MRQHHVAGDKAFVDYSGKRIGIADPATGEIREAEIFVGVLGASNLTYAEATWTQQLADWTGAHVRMFRFFGGVPKLLVPDNLKSGVNKASFYDPEINRTYGAMAAHYSVGILPARPRKPRDKAKVEAGVRFAHLGDPFSKFLAAALWGDALRHGLLQRRPARSGWPRRVYPTTTAAAAGSDRSGPATPRPGSPRQPASSHR